METDAATLAGGGVHSERSRDTLSEHSQPDSSAARYPCFDWFRLLRGVGDRPVPRRSQSGGALASQRGLCADFPGYKRFHRDFCRLFGNRKNRPMIELNKTAYGLLTLAAILTSIFVWRRIARRDERLVLIYVAALAGAFLGAKVVYLAAEGWSHWQEPNRWLIWATGKSITGALLG